MSAQDKPSVSILMANYNNEEFIEEAIESVVSQTYSDWELIIVDDASEDNSVDKAARYAQIDERILFYENDKNLGYIKTLRKLLDLASAEIVGVLDSDDKLEEAALEEVMRIYQSKPEAGLVYTQSYHCDRSLKPFGIGYSDYIPADGSNLHYNAVHHFRIFKKSLYKKIGGYDEEMLYAEDIDLVYRLEEVSNFHFVNKPLYFYRVLGNSQSHGFINVQINRSSTALAKLNAHKRRVRNADKFYSKTFTKNELSELLILGVISSFLCGRRKLTRLFIKELVNINPLFFLRPTTYFLIEKKILKIFRLKKNYYLVSSKPVQLGHAVKRRLAGHDAQSEKVVSDKYQFIFYSIPKVASRSIISDINKKIPDSTIFTSRKSEFSKSRLGGARYFTFAFVRNPWGRVVSCYLDKIKYPSKMDADSILNKFPGLYPGMPFREFVLFLDSPMGRDRYADRHWLSQYIFLNKALNNSALDYIGHFESLDKDWQHVCSLLELPQSPLKHFNSRFGWNEGVLAGKSPDPYYYRQYYDNETMNLIYKRFIKDIQMFNYKF